MKRLRRRGLELAGSARPPEIWLADLVRSLDGLRPSTRHDALAIALALGLSPAEAEGAIRTTRPELFPRIEERPTPHVTEAVQGPAEPAPPPGEGAGVIPFDLVRSETLVQGRLPPVQALKPSSGDSVDEPPLLQPLFVPLWTRAILTSALATDGGEGPLDIERLVEVVARREKMEELPRLSSATLRRGVQLLLDKSPGMVPFGRDQAVLQKQVQDVVGRPKVQVWRFDGNPFHAGLGTRRTWTEYHVPARGTVVLVLTDLGLGRPPLGGPGTGVETWAEFAGYVRKAGCPLVAMVPYGPARWPQALIGLLDIIPWDHWTTAAKVRHLIGGIHEVTR